MIRRHKEAGFSQISWPEAEQIAAETLVRTASHRTRWIATREGPTDETWFVFSHVARAISDCNAEMVGISAGSLAEIVGTDAAICGLSDWIGTDLLVIWGAHLAVHQPDALRYLSAAKAEGTRVVVVNPAAEHALGAPLGTRLADDLIQIKTGGDEALAVAVLTMLARWGLASAPHLDQETLDRKIEEAGVRYNEVEWLARLVSRSSSMVSTWGAGLGRPGAARAVVAIHLARSMFGRPRCGWMPLDRHSGGPGARACGVVPFEDDAPLPDAVVCLGGLPAPLARNASSIGARIHIDTALDETLLEEPAEGGYVLLLPAMTRYEQPMGGVVMSVERRIRFSPQIPLSPPLVAEALPDALALASIARAALPDRPDLAPWADLASIRRAMSAAIPEYAGVERLCREGEFVQWGGPRLLSGGLSAETK